MIVVYRVERALLIWLLSSSSIAGARKPRGWTAAAATPFYRIVLPIGATGLW
jgi:hypothetical protein